MSSNRPTAPVATPVDVKAPSAPAQDVKSDSTNSVTKAITKIATRPIARPTRWDKLPDDAITKIAEFIPDIKGHFSLRAVNTSYRHAALQAQGKFSFFQQHYSLHVASGQQLLDVEKLTAPHVRAGNQLVKEAIQCMFQGNLAAADKLLYRAMYRHGSFYAMMFISRISQLPGKYQIFDIYALASLYHRKAEEVLGKEYSLFTASVESEEKRKQFDNGLASVKRMLNRYVLNATDAYSKAYPGSRFAAEFKKEFDILAEGDLQEATEAAASYIHIAPSLAADILDPYGFIGDRAPLTRKTIWFLETNDHKAFIELEKTLDSFDQHKSAKSNQLFLK